MPNRLHEHDDFHPAGPEPELGADLPSGETGSGMFEIEAPVQMPGESGAGTDSRDEFSPRTGVVYDYYYENYLMLYSLYGRGRPKLARRRYEELDRELLGLVSSMQDATGETPQQLARQSFNRIRELEYMLLDDVAEALLDQRGRDTPPEPAAAAAGAESQASLPRLEFRWSEDAQSLTP